MDYDTELERVANAFQTVPRKLSEDNVRMLGALNHFETFEDDLTEEGESGSYHRGKRLSLSGSIVVLDLDFIKSGQVLAVNVSLSRETASESGWSAMAPVNDPSGHLLRSLQQPRLEAFARMLSFLSRCDRFSTKDIDCFRALDLVSEAIHLHLEKTGTTSFGRPVMNPPNRIGLGLEYMATNKKKYYAYLDISPGSRREFSLKKYRTVEDYLDMSSFDWKQTTVLPTRTNVESEAENTPGNGILPLSSDSDARAELVLSLDPPVLMSETYAMDLQAFISNLHPDIDQRFHNIAFAVPRHNRFASVNEKKDEFDAKIGVMLPYRLVEVSQIPLTGPDMIPTVLEHLKQSSLAFALINSLIERGSEACWSTEAVDLNIGDALAMREQPVHRKSGGQLSVSLRSTEENNIEILVAWVLSELSLKIDIPLGQPPKVMIQPSSVLLNMRDIQTLIEGGDLALALSYTLCSIGQLRRRASSSIQ